jgi:photosystem II stability/assembly factor-like uncharacterized protein
MVDETAMQDVVHSLAASPDFARDGVCFAARPSGLYRSSDGGLTWQPAYASLPSDGPFPTAAVALSPDFASDHSLFAGVPGAVLRSTDGGHDWHIAALQAPPPFVSALVVSPNYTADGTLLAATVEDGVFRSGDRGAHWAAWNFGLLDLNVLSLAVSPNYARDETLFAGTDSGIFRSTTGGRAWREVEAGDGGARSTDFAPVLSLAISPQYATDGVVFAGSEAHGLWCSRDRGRSWARLGEGVVEGAVNSILLAPGFPSKPHILVLLGDTLLISRDGGVKWAEWRSGLDVGGSVTCVAAPLGLDVGAPLLLGLADGRVLRV